MSCMQDSLGPCLSLLTALRTLHINYPMGPGSPFLPQTQILSILNECSPTITQFGCNTRVWQVSQFIKSNARNAVGGWWIIFCLGIANDWGWWRWFNGSRQDSGTIRDFSYSRTVSRRADIVTRMLLFRFKITRPFLVSRSRSSQLSTFTSRSMRP